MLLQVGAPILAGVFFLLYALVLWVWGQRRHSLALRWFSLTPVGCALCAGFAAVLQLFHPRTFDLYSDLVIGNVVPRGCACPWSVWCIASGKRGGDPGCNGNVHKRSRTRHPWLGRYGCRTE